MSALALRAAARVAGLAARAAVRALDGFARRQALLAATGGVTLSDLLLIVTATWGDVQDDAPVPSDRGVDFSAAVGAAGVAVVACALAGCLAGGTDVVGEAQIDRRRTVSRRRGTKRSTAS
ncbi:hypothetical protein ACP4OV_003849 [Aristida adscensionis]